MRGAAARAHRNAVFRLRSNTASHCATGRFSMGPIWARSPPALFTRMSTPPWIAAQCSNRDATSASCVRSARRLSQDRPSAETLAESRSSPARSRSTATTWAPSFAKARQYAPPSPPPAPVTSATLPLNRCPVTRLAFQDLHNLFLRLLGGLPGVAALQHRNDRGANGRPHFRHRDDQRIGPIRHGIRDLGLGGLDHVRWNRFGIDIAVVDRAP